MDPSFSQKMDASIYEKCQRHRARNFCEALCFWNTVQTPYLLTFYVLLAALCYYTSFELYINHRNSYVHMVCNVNGMQCKSLVLPVPYGSILLSKTKVSSIWEESVDSILCKTYLAALFEKKISSYNHKNFSCSRFIKSCTRPCAIAALYFAPCVLWVFYRHFLSVTSNERLLYDHITAYFDNSYCAFILK